MNNNYDDSNEEDYQPQYVNSQQSNPRVIEIPVQHFTSNPPNPSNPKNATANGNANGNGHFHSEKFKNNQPGAQDFFNRNQGIFDDFKNPFGKYTRLVFILFLLLLFIVFI